LQLSFDIDEYVVFDLETTGLSPWAGDEIIEIGAIKIFGSEIDEKNVFHSLVNPGRPIPSEATKINGITNEMVKDAPPFREVIGGFLDFVGNAWLVAQNAKFDMSFIIKSMLAANIHRELEVYDTVLMSKRVFPECARHNLDVICERLRLTYDSSTRHRSLEDAKITALAFLELKKRLEDRCPQREKWNV